MFVIEQDPPTVFVRVASLNNYLGHPHHDRLKGCCLRMSRPSGPPAAHLGPEPFNSGLHVLRNPRFLSS
jgi:hypothetical protein